MITNSHSVLTLFAVYVLIFSYTSNCDAQYHNTRGYPIAKEGILTIGMDAPDLPKNDWSLVGAKVMVEEFAMQKGIVHILAIVDLNKREDLRGLSILSKTLASSEEGRVEVLVLTAGQDKEFLSLLDKPISDDKNSRTFRDDWSSFRFHFCNDLKIIRSYRAAARLPVNALSLFVIGENQKIEWLNHLTGRDSRKSINKRSEQVVSELVDGSYDREAWKSIIFPRQYTRTVRYRAEDLAQEGKTKEAMALIDRLVDDLGYTSIDVVYTKFRTPLRFSPTKTVDAIDEWIADVPLEFLSAFLLKDKAIAQLPRIQAVDKLMEHFESERIQDAKPADIAGIYSQAGNFYFYEKQYRDSVLFYEKALSFAIKIQSDSSPENRDNYIGELSKSLAESQSYALPLLELGEFLTKTDDWTIMNDNVMGGNSTGQFETSGAGLSFFGKVVTDGGGFTLVRTEKRKFGFKDIGSISLSCRGDGRTYLMELLTGANIGFMPISYRAEFTPKKGEWSDVTIDISEFKPTAFGEVIDDSFPQWAQDIFTKMYSFSPSIYSESDRWVLRVEDVNQIGFVIADKKDGDFRIEIRDLQRNFR